MTSLYINNKVLFIDHDKGRVNFINHRLKIFIMNQSEMIKPSILKCIIQKFIAAVVNPTSCATPVVIKIFKFI